MTRHDDPDTTTPIDTTTSDAPVDEVERLRGALDLSMRTLTETLHGILDVIAPDGDGYVMENGDIAWDAVWETLTAGYVHEADRRPNVPASPARVSTLAELDALPVGSIVRLASGAVFVRSDRSTAGWDWHAPGDSQPWTTGDLTTEHEDPFTLLHVPGRDLLAEARAEVAELREQRNQATAALAEAPGFMSVWREAEARGVERARVNLAAQVVKAEATAVAEAEARGYERGKRDALADLRSRVYNGAPDPYQAFYNYGLAPLLDAEIDRAAETPGGAA